MSLQHFFLFVFIHIVSVRRKCKNEVKLHNYVEDNNNLEVIVLRNNKNVTWFSLAKDKLNEEK